MSTLQLVGLVLALFLALAAGFSHTIGMRMRRNTCDLHMTSSFGVQKLGEKVIGTPVVTETSEVETPGLFRSGRIGSGLDERFSAVDKGVEREQTIDMLVFIDKSLRQQSLLMSLSEDSVLGFADKAERVRLAAHEGLLPSSMAAGSMMSPTQLQSGGLFQDWDFEM